jgi:hypothetical protein
MTRGVGYNAKDVRGGLEPLSGPFPGPGSIVGTSLMLQTRPNRTGPFTKLLTHSTVCLCSRGNPLQSPSQIQESLGEDAWKNSESLQALAPRGTTHTH